MHAAFPGKEPRSAPHYLPPDSVTEDQQHVRMSQKQAALRRRVQQACMRFAAPGGDPAFATATALDRTNEEKRLRLCIRASDQGGRAGGGGRSARGGGGGSGGARGARGPRGRRARRGAPRRPAPAPGRCGGGGCARARRARRRAGQPEVVAEGAGGARAARPSNCVPARAAASTEQIELAPRRRPFRGSVHMLGEAARSDAAQRGIKAPPLLSARELAAGRRQRRHELLCCSLACQAGGVARLPAAEQGIAQGGGSTRCYGLQH